MHFEEAHDSLALRRAPPAAWVAARNIVRVIFCQRLRKRLWAAMLLICTPYCFAERADRTKPLLLEADQVVVDDSRQTSTFTGRVQLNQGTMQIRGDKIELVKYKDGFKQARAYGNTASFRQKREGLEEYVEGNGERIEYDTRTGFVDFYVQARVRREMDEIRGDHIIYSMKTESFQVSSNADSMNAPPQRVRAVLQPKPKTAETSMPPRDIPATPGKTPAPME